MQRKSVKHINGPNAFRESFAVSRETLDRLETYATLLTRWQKTINLVAPSTIANVWHRHFADSAQLWAHRPEAAKTWLDLGSGAGFPGLVVAILAAETGGTRHTLVESDTRKAAFLREVARETGVAVDILCSRIESPETRTKVARIDCVTARALAPMPKLLQWAHPCFGPKTTGLFLKGRGFQAELDTAVAEWRFASEIVPSVTEADAAVVIVRQLHLKVL